MADRTLTEAAEKAGVSINLIRKHIQRGKLRSTKSEDGRIMVSDEDLDLYIAGSTLGEMSDVAHSVAETGKTLQAASGEIGNLFGQIPSSVQSAILEGIPTSKRQGDSKAYEKAVKDVPKRPHVSEVSDDPHFGHPIGYRHKASPRWRRVNSSTWELDGATWSHNGLFWEGGGTAAGRELGEGISPAAPASDRRPLAPAKPVKR